MVNQRPKYHFMPPANWMNDPNGLVQHQGVYHLFYQHNPDAAVWGNIHWGHASSLDLVHWQHLPLALAPTSGGPDESGVWSGCMVEWDGLPTAVYTGRRGETENVCLAISRDGLLTWEKHPRNPVITVPTELETEGFRDPYAWQENGRWKMVIGSGIRGQGGAVLQYTSPDLLEWQYEGPLLVGDADQLEPVWTGEMWECPNFFPLSDEHVLMISPMDLHPSRSLYTLYMVGAYTGSTFQPRHIAKMDGGDVYFYAPQAFKDSQGRRIAMGWSREARSEKAAVQDGWAGVMTLPRLISIRADGQLTQQPVPEIQALRGEGRAWKDIPLPVDQGPVTLDGLAGDTLELEVIFHLGAASENQEGELGLLVRRSPDDEEVTEIRVDLAAKVLVVDTLRSSLSSEDYPGAYEIQMDLSGANLLTLRVFLDHSIIEVFANDVAVITTRVYPTRSSSTGIGFFARRNPGLIASLQAWEMGEAV